MRRHGGARDTQAGVRVGRPRFCGVRVGARPCAPSMRSRAEQPAERARPGPVRAGARAHLSGARGEGRGGEGLFQEPGLVSFGQLSLVSWFWIKELQGTGMCRNKLCFIHIAKC